MTNQGTRDFNLKVLSQTQRAVLVAAGQDGTVIYRGKLDLRFSAAPASTLRALAGHGLVELKFVTVDVYSRSGLYYKGKRTQLDYGRLTELGQAVRAILVEAKGKLVR